jgi:hypothetical protein
MTNSIANFDYKKALKLVDWKLLMFLVLFLNVKLAVKIPAIAIMYLLQPNFRFGFSFKNSRIPLFYLLIIVIPFISFVINKNYTNPDYLIMLFTGIGFWLLCILAVHQVKLSVESNDTETVHRTILVFFIINTVFSFYNIAHIMWHIKTLNPYLYQGERQKYFISTGDFIKGLTFDTSTTNAVLNAFGVIYFLVRKNTVMVFICMAVLLLTASNAMNITLLLIMALLFVFKSTKDQKSVIAVCFMLLVVFMVKISPQNNRYVNETFTTAILRPKIPTAKVMVCKNNTDTVISPEQMRVQIARHYLDSIAPLTAKKPEAVPKALAALPKTDQGRIVVIKPDINTLPFQSSTDTSADQKQLLAFIETNKGQLPLSSEQDFHPGLPGKAMGFKQSLVFLLQYPVKMLAGAGMGNFSSKLAFRATGLGFAGGYPIKHIYINKDFVRNHLDIYLNFFSKRNELHSLVNSPFSVYDQLLAEYGLLGLLAFVIYYWGFFARYYQILSYGLPLLILITVVFLTDYWFEQLSVIVMFELMLFLNIKENTNKSPKISYAN